MMGLPKLSSDKWMEQYYCQIYFIHQLPTCCNKAQLLTIEVLRSRTSPRTFCYHVIGVIRLVSQYQLRHHLYKVLSIQMISNPFLCSGLEVEQIFIPKVLIKSNFTKSYLKKQQNYQIHFFTPFILLMLIEHRQTYFLIPVLFVFLTATNCASSPGRLLGLVSTNRTETLFLRCPNTRSVFFASQTNESQSWARQQTAASLKSNGSALIYAILSNNPAGIEAEVKTNLPSTIVYFIFIAIGLVIMLVFSIIMICCACKPRGCPPCCRKQVYTSCEKTWPAAAVIFLSLVALGCMIGVLVVNGDLQQGYQQTRCSIAIFFDDLINGNFTSDGSKYFIGLKPLKANLSSQLNSSGLVKNSLTTPVSLDNIIDEIENIKTDVQNIPNSNKKQLQLKYVTPINTDPLSVGPNSPTTSSKFNSILGQTQLGDSLIGKIYASLESMKGVVRHWLDSKKVGISISPLQKYADLTDKVENLDKSIDSSLTTIKAKYIDPISIAIYVLAGVVMLFCTFLILASVLVCCGKFSFRKFLYFSCTFLTLLGVVFFLLALVFSLTTAAVYYGCDYVEGALQSKALFEYRFGPVFNNEVLTKMIAQCVTKESTGIIVNSQEPKQLGSSSSGSLSQITKNLANHKSELMETVNSYQRAEVTDLDSQTDIGILQQLSDSTKYTCSATGFGADSWVPTTNQQQVYVPCKLQQMDPVNNQTCNSTQQFESRAPGCQGCIDTLSILSQVGSSLNVLPLLNKRYPSDDCSPFNQELSNVWNNYYQKKADYLSPVEQKANVASTKIDSLISMTQQLSSSSTGLSSVPVGGVVTKLSCQVLSEDLSLLTNTFCTGIFNFSFRMRVLTITASFSLLLAMFCSTCFGMRTYKDGKTILPPGSSKDFDNEVIISQHQN